ncbi:M15 family metallopeptidase [Aureispira anguillae]|uniref:D-alanyl-D-alanine dipeptidase n=1 Tax=Aureispira anguillae TaxID=2864201 RepID=A0A915YL96_9BACT|nr:M15 family metallopeptidase [Aureispira anguillae]BDS15299.1 M15 family metallopeptidase [Aureispira anguillae]
MKTIIAAHKLLLSWTTITLLCIACSSPNTTPTPMATHLIDSTQIDRILLDSTPPQPTALTEEELDSIFNLNDSTWVNLKELYPKIVLDLRYATTNNFMKLQIYDCPKCYLRLATAKALLKAQDELEKQNLGFKMFDCYRPQSAQYKLWKKVPDPRYVSPPSRGSMHSRGGALDLTIINLENGEELEMGTEYDYFGKKAYWSNKNLPQQVLDNRQLLRNTLEFHGFKTVTTEWWHFSYRRAWFKLSNMQWDCSPDE